MSSRKRDKQLKFRSVGGRLFLHGRISNMCPEPTAKGQPILKYTTKQLLFNLSLGKQLCGSSFFCWLGCQLVDCPSKHRLEMMLTEFKQSHPEIERQMPKERW